LAWLVGGMGGGDVTSRQAQCVRHLVLFPQHAKAVVKAGAIPLLNKLTESKVRETRLHAQGALLSLGGSADALEIMQKCEVRAQSYRACPFLRRSEF
jgi:hypothetical protein